MLETLLAAGLPPSLVFLAVYLHILYGKKDGRAGGSDKSGRFSKAELEEAQDKAKEEATRQAEQKAWQAQMLGHAEQSARDMKKLTIAVGSLPSAIAKEIAQ